MKIARPTRLIFAALGIGLFVLVLRRVGPSRVLDSLHLLGWGILAMVALGGVLHLVKTWAWRFSFARRYRTMPFREMLAIRLAGEAVGQITIGGPALCETTRVFLADPEIPTAQSISSVTLDRTLYSLTGALILAASLLLLPFALGSFSVLPVSSFLVVVGLVGFGVLIALAFRRRWPVLSTVFGWLSRIGPLKAWTEAGRARVLEVERNLYSLYDEDPSAFWAAFALNAFSHWLAILEVYLALWILGLNPTLLAAFFIEGWTKAANVMGILIPGNVGAYEASNVVFARVLGFGGPAGLALALARDVRRLFWLSVGMGILLLFSFRSKGKSTMLAGRRTSPIAGA